MEQILDELDFFKEKFNTLYISSDKKIDRQIFEERGHGFIFNKLLLLFVLYKPKTRFRVATLDDYRDLPIPKFFDPLIDLSVQILSDQFIGNCVSSFTGFIVRQRRVKHLPVAFWGLVDHSDAHEEL